MEFRFQSVLSLLISLSISGCGWVGVKSDMFGNAPVWESAQIKRVHKHDPAKDKQSLTMSVSASDAPGLSLLAHQVLGAQASDKTGILATSFADENPLTDELAKDTAMKAIVKSMVAVYSEVKGAHAELENDQLSRDDLEKFSNKALKQAYGTFGSAPEDKKIEDMSQRIVLAVKNNQITFGRILWQYLNAYYNGSFIDRTGGKVQKPKIGLTITNESITGFLSVFLEALHDFAIMRSTVFKVPVVYEGSGAKLSWFNSSQTKPAFAELFPDPENATPYIEPLQPDHDKDGITKEKWQYINFAAGLAGDQAQGLAGVIVRALGGANLGFVFMGKLSFGDNQTLTKIADTFVETNVKRLTATAISSILYPLHIPAGTPIPSP